MNIALLEPPMTVPEYLSWGDSQSERKRTELINGRIVAMSPERAAHNRLKKRIVIALELAIEKAGLDCEAFTDGMTVPIDAHTAYEPDALVNCGAAIPPNELTAPTPIVVVEVLSPTSIHTDTSAKLIGYFKLPSVLHYLVIDPDARTLTHHRRQADGAIAALTLSSGPLHLSPPGLDVQVDPLFGA
jgi:Uma2 family endonuclease